MKLNLDVPLLLTFDGEQMEDGGKKLTIKDGCIIALLTDTQETQRLDKIKKLERYYC